MKNNGFTLVELLATIVIIGVIALITTVASNNILKSSKENAYNIQVNEIIDATKGYIIQYGLAIEELQEVGTVVDISLTTLNEVGLIELPIINPITGVEFDIDVVSVKVKKKINGLYDYCFYNPDNTNNLCTGMAAS